MNAAAFQRWIGESVAVLLPFSALGGELVRARLAILFGIPAAPAFASIVMDAVVAVISQVLFFAVGIVLYLDIATTSQDLMQPALLGGFALMAALAAIWLGIRARALGRFARLITPMLGAERATWLADTLDSVDGAVAAVIDDRPAFVRSVAWRVLGWLLGAAELWLILALLGHPITVAEALMLDALTSAVKTTFFFVPGGVGVQEATLLVLGATVGVDRDMMLAAALIKRARELLLGIPGALAWQIIETRRLSD